MQRKPMNIAFILATSIDSVGGIERVTMSLTREFESRGHMIYLVSTKGKELPTTDKHQYFFPNPKVNSKENENFLFLFLKHKKIDLAIFQHGDDGYVPFPHLYKKARTRLLVVVSNDPDWFEKHIHSKVSLRRIFKITGHFKSFRKRRKVAKIYKQNASFAGKIILLSPSYIPVMAKYIDSVDREKLVAIPNPATGVQREHFEDKKKEVLFVGRLHNITKRVDLLLKAWALLEKRFPEWILRIVGDGPDRNSLEKLAKELGLSRVFFEGFQDPAPYYRSASVFCLTSAYEGFPMVLLEAASYGCVLVAFDSFGSVRDIIEDGASGVLVPAFDIEKYAEKLSELMLDPTLRLRLSVNAQKSVTRFSSEKIGAQWEKLFQEVLERDN